MAKEFFRDTRFNSRSREKIDQMVEIIEEYQQQGLRLTARQLYYQFVSRDLCPNLPAEYKKLTALLTDARYAGLVDWNAIEDRGRQPSTPSEWNDLASLADSALAAYRLPRWNGQEHYVELWVEKQALAGVLEPLAREHHVTLMVNKGYSSASAMKESAERINAATMLDEGGLKDFNRRIVEVTDEFGEDSDELNAVCDELRNALPNMLRKTTILYLGDHDPSGEDMVRDIDARLKEFGVLDLHVFKVGLTIEQVRQYNPPPNPAKVTDPRAKAYRAKFGDQSWEVDALPPNVLARLIRMAFNARIDVDKMDEIKAREELDKKRLRAAVSDIMNERA